MSPALNDDMVDGMDDTAGLLSPNKPAAPSSVFLWRGQPNQIGPSLRPHPMSRNPKPNSKSFPVEGREAGQKAFDKRQALLRAEI
ncbi:hypothetical protein [uncultured Variovorax sp.]|uniref:hypothetical protein n=1 Tax=uncultured Variovorax sp. TaxID=114708 RepID=UPI0025DDD115|nr:hypothetical protein [uncultured Variovorax sp.]